MEDLKVADQILTQLSQIKGLLVIISIYLVARDILGNFKK